MVETQTVVFGFGFLAVALLLLVSDWLLKRWLQPFVRRFLRHRDPGLLRIGVIGSSSRPFDQSRAKQALRTCFDKFAAAADSSHAVLEVVSGLTAQGVPKLAYEEAARRGWRTAGIACDRAKELKCWPCDRVVIVGHNWGDESATFLAQIDVLVSIGHGGAQSQAEYQAFSKFKMLFDIDSPSASLQRPSEVLNMTDSELKTD